MRDKPGSLRSVVLDSTVPLQANWQADRAANFQRSLDLLFAACAADADCNAAFPDLQRVTSDLVAKLNSSPVTVEVKDPSSERTTRFVVTGDRLLGGLGDVLYQTSLIPLLPMGIYAIASGDYGVIAMLAAEIFMFEDVALGVTVSVDCSESTPFLTPDIVAEANKDVRSEIARVVWGISTQEDLEREIAFCRELGVKEPEAKEHEAVTSDMPTLVLAGEYDPFTPPSYGRLAAETLSQSHVVEFPATGQGVLYGRAPCAMKLIAAFLDDPKTRPDDSCARQLGPPEFLVP
jgi:pimeloyl-ACP methyl ester carboxylesterase